MATVTTVMQRAQSEHVIHYGGIYTQCHNNLVKLHSMHTLLCHNICCVPIHHQINLQMEVVSLQLSNKRGSLYTHTLNISRLLLWRYNESLQERNWFSTNTITFLGLSSSFKFLWPLPGIVQLIWCSTQDNKSIYNIGVIHIIRFSAV